MTSDTIPLPIIHHISNQAFADESTVMRNLLHEVECYAPHMDAIETRAERYITTIRAAGVHGGVEEFIHQFGLKEKEAVGLLCLAESLLRIPDADTADALIADRLQGADWRKFLQENNGFSLHARAWGLMLSTKLTDMQDSESLIAQTIHTMSEPALRHALKAAMHLLGKSFVAGNSINSALKLTRKHREQGYLFSFDMLGEGARSEAQAEHYLNNYLSALDALHEQHTQGTQKLYSRDSISVKLSALYPRYEYRQKEQVMDVLYARLKQICMRAKSYHLAVSIDSEEADRLELELLLFAKLMADEDLQGFDGLGFVLQAYQKRALPVIDYLKELATLHNRQIPVRLVKGAYWDSEIKWAQMAGLPSYPVFTRKRHSDVSYLACARRLLEARTCFFPQFATHNALSAAAIITYAETLGLQDSYEFQRLYGMGDAFYDQMIDKRPCRIYAPVGPFKDLLPYLIRRLMENGANSNFINQLMDDSADIADLLKSPISRTIETLQEKQPRITLPVDLFADRPNSAGYCLGNIAHIEYLQASQAPHLTSRYTISSIIDGQHYPTLHAMDIMSPCNVDDIIGQVSLADETTLRHALDAAQKGFSSWRNKDMNIRADVLDKMAALLKTHEGEYYALLAREAGKTLPDAIDELREAIDFCYYYAMQARDLAKGREYTGYTGESNQLHYVAKGVVACISPWNFPLAIFIGQVAAALVAGNSVLAKPSEHTNIIAARAVAMFHEAGIPTSALHYIPARGAIFGDVVLSHPAISAVAFTGSTATAQRINQTLAARDAPIARLIAETGGQNCMIVDSSALLEQAVDDIIASAFGCAGQRCSALRVLYIQDSIADTLIAMLDGAMQQLVIGQAHHIDTDVSAVISKEAQHGLLSHINDMSKAGYSHASTPLSGDCEGGYYVAPHLCVLPNIDILTQEHFGPILHVIPYNIDMIDDIISQINSTGYGLTFGIHSRIESRIAYVSKRIDAGNIYVNRSMTGAIVGVQPFGGMGLSGTGPKAGGIHYVQAFTDEQLVTHNETAIGGNLGLLG